MSLSAVNLGDLAERWTSPYVAREEIERFTGGLLTAKYLANLDSLGKGPKGRIRCGRKVAYPVKNVISFMEARSVALDEE